MFHFLRRLRISLFSSGATRKPVSPFGKYFLYAIGEILLVVIGILIALQINNWNQERLNRQLEKKYLNRLVLDLESNVGEINRAIRKSEINLILAEKILTILGADTLSYLGSRSRNVSRNNVTLTDSTIRYKGKIYKSDIEQTLGAYFTLLSEFYSFILSKPTFDDLMATGKIEVIRDDNIRNEIQDYYSKMNADSDYEDIYFYPHFQHYRNTLTRMAIPHGIKISASEVLELLVKDKSLSVAIQNLYYAHDKVLRILYGRKNRIFRMKNSIENSNDYPGIQ